MEEMAKHPRMTLRKGTRNWQFRAKIPVDLQEVYGKKEITYSLRTANYQEALEKTRIASVKLDQEFAEKRRQRDAEAVDKLSEIEVERITAIWRHEALQADEESRINGLSPTEFQSWDDAITFAYVEARESLATGNLNRISVELDDLLDQIGMKVAKGSEVYKQLAYALLKAKVETLEALKARHEGRVVKTPPESALPVTVTPMDTDKNDPTITQVHAMWAEEHLAADGPEKTVKDFGTYVRRFVELHGDLPVSQITKKHVRDYKDAMLKYPSRRVGKLKDMTVPQLLEYVREHPDTPVISPRTVNDRALGAIGAVLGWAESNDYIETNPASGVKVKAMKVKRTARLPYSVEDLNTIFRFPIYTENDRPQAGAGEAAKWLPLLAAFTGARLEELGQLTLDDIREDQNIKYLDMSTLDEGKRRKTESSKRRVPIHSKIIELGFLDYVEEIKKSGRKRLFPYLASSGEKRTASWSKWWGRYARKYGGFDKLKVFHSFRHAFKDGLREGGVQEEVSDALTGHAPTTEGRKYGGNGYPLKRLKEGVEKLCYPGLEIDHLKS
ncbi:site-specific integrase [Maridesulfovibrio bastinii]|uniref:site-specific integrase n=1 Tax=Maridesulfovibrio bastinii TaxID=47157 RepID=UPI0012EB50B1|nr:site-specific integrase [Maridesulfovibrio bastinii]